MLLTVIHAVAGVSKLLKIWCSRALVKNLLYQTVGPDILWNIFTIWLITLTRNAFDAPQMIADLFAYICDVTFEFHAIGTRGNSLLNTDQNLHQAGDPIEKHTDLLKTDTPQLSRICHFHWQRQCASEIQLLNTSHDQNHCRHGKQMTPVWFSSISHAQSPAKTGTRIFATGGGGDCDTCHQDNAVTWQRRLQLLSIKTLNCF